MNNLQRRFYARSLVDKRVVISDMRSGDVGATKDARLYIMIEPSRTYAPPYCSLGVFEVGAAGNRIIHYSHGIDDLGVSRSDVLAYLTEQLHAWKLKAFHEILDA